ncbi:MAG: hypothetical protein K8U57_10435 [Planctomycetes bacterium]|nr:hypothetical protein [Planctomycetota bacterium]
MRLMSFFASVTAVAMLAGCGGDKPTGLDPAATAPLTIEQWKALPAEAKYQVPNLERLKDGDPKFKDEREWEKFLRTVVNPGKKKELPAVKS